MERCDYCLVEIPKGRYPSYKRQKGKGMYCCEEHKGRAGILRMAFKNKKYTLKNLDETDNRYLKDLSLKESMPMSKEEMYA